MLTLFMEVLSSSMATSFNHSNRLRTTHRSREYPQPVASRRERSTMKKLPVDAEAKKMIDQPPMSLNLTVFQVPTKCQPVGVHRILNSGRTTARSRLSSKAQSLAVTRRLHFPLNLCIAAPLRRPRPAYLRLLLTL